MNVVHKSEKRQSSTYREKEHSENHQAHIRGLPILNWF